MVASLRERGFSIIDCMVNVSPGDSPGDIRYMPREAFRDRESLEAWPSSGVVSYLFKGATAERAVEASNPARVVELLDQWGIERCNVILNDDAAAKIDKLQQHGDRWFFSLRVNPHEGMQEVRRLSSMASEHPNIKSVCISPHALVPTIPANSKEYYPIYAKCVELELPVFVNVGIPGPRVPGWTQDPLFLDEVCWFFPDLKVVMKHGGEPWVDMCVKLMVKWPNLYYATSGFSPKHYPKAIIDYANTRGSDRILYAGYWPILSFDDIFEQVEALPLRDHVWAKMFRENARTVFRLP